MGFNKQKMMTKDKFPELLSQAYQSLETPTTALVHNTNVHPFLKRFHAEDMRDVSGNAVKYKSIYGHSRRHVGFTRDQNERIVFSRGRNAMLNVRPSLNHRKTVHTACNFGPSNGPQKPSRKMRKTKKTLITFCSARGFSG
jgi:hypothetical protein